jgi:3-isopropylmalate/(R)-2-methylmalate dehydratase small subunit
VIAKSFADIFYNNSAKNGLLLITLPDAAIDSLFSAAQSGELELTIDLERQIVSAAAEGDFSFDYDPFRKHCILHGLDDIDYILSHSSEISEFRQWQKDSGLVTVSTKRN